MSAPTPTSSLAFQNFFSATLTSDITSSATDIPMDTIPNGTEGFLVIEPDSTTAREVIYFNSKTATKVTCPSAALGRGQDDTTASSHLQGSAVIMAPVAAFYEALQSGSAQATSLLDKNGNVWVRKGATASAVNDITITNAVTGNAPTISATGSDTNVSLNLVPKGTGEIQISGTGISGAWQSWTPTWTNLTIGNATQTAKYKQIGKTVHFYIDIVLGSTSSVSTTADFTVPVTAVSRDGLATTQPYGIARYFDTSASATALGFCFYKSTTTAVPHYFAVSGSLVSSGGFTSTAPFTWATGDNIHIQGTYEAA